MYDYANARIRALRALLLGPHDMEALAALPGLSDLVAAMGRTDYAPFLEAARPRLAGLPLVEEAVRRNVTRRLRGVLGFFTLDPVGAAGEGPRLARVLLGRVDLRNLVAVLRGKAAAAAPEQIETAVVPAGRLSEAQLGSLARSVDVTSCIAAIERLDLGYTAPLAAALTAYVKDRGLPALELALRRGFVEWAVGQLRDGGANAALVREALAQEADAANLLLAMRLARRGARPDAAALVSLLYPGGTLRAAALAALLQHGSPGAIVAGLAPSPLKRALLAADGLSATVGEDVAPEWAVERFLARWARAQVLRDPLGIGLVLAYQSAKVEEARTIRLIARGLAAGWPRERVRHLLAAA